LQKFNLTEGSYSLKFRFSELELEEYPLRSSARPLVFSVMLAIGVAAIAFNAKAAPIGAPLTMAKPEAFGMTQPVYWRGRGWGWGGPFIAGAVIGGAIAAPYYYGPGPYYYPPYAPPPAYAAGPPPDDAEAYCMQRFKSYDPNTGTYRGTDGHRHPCP
jgi:hypothetical protein